MQHLINIFAIFSGVASWIYHFLIKWYHYTIEAGVSPSITTLILIFIAISLLLASGFWAATTAELRLRVRPPHFVLGLLLPGIYPLLIFFLLPKAKPAAVKIAEEEALEPEEVEDDGVLRIHKGNRPFKIKHKEEESEEKQDDSKEKIKERTDSNEDEEEDDVVLEETANVFRDEALEIDKEAAKEFLVPMDKTYFRSIAVDVAGNPQGPFMMELVDGQFIEILKILEARDEVVVLEIQGANPGETRRIRVPYKRVTSCKLSSEWLDQV